MTRVKRYVTRARALQLDSPVLLNIRVCKRDRVRSFINLPPIRRVVSVTLNKPENGVRTRRGFFNPFNFFSARTMRPALQRRVVYILPDNPNR